MKKETTCRTCKKTFIPIRQNGIIVSRKCKGCLWKQEREKRKKVTKKLKKINSKSKVIKDLDSVFSEFIRRRDKGICISCGVKKPWKQQQCGHYIRRSCMNTRWNEFNCSCQCVACNMFRGGNYPAYSLALMNKYGAEIIELLNEEGRQIRKWTILELKNLIEIYKKKLLKLK